MTTLRPDGLGSVRAVTDDSGAVAERTTYRPFGEEVAQQQALTLPESAAGGAMGPSPPPHGFIGERFDDASGLQYLNARYYDPKLAMFVQPDWWEVTQPGIGTNRYSYSFNDPVNAKDPGGHQYERERYEEEETRIDRDYANGGMTKDEYEAEIRAFENRRQLDPAMRPTGLDYDHWDAMADAMAAAQAANFGNLSLPARPGDLVDTPRNAAAVSTKPPSTIAQNQISGASRERINEARLSAQYPGASVQNQQYLRTKDGVIAKDPKTGTGRRLDHVVVENGCVTTCRETTSMTANKAAQQAKETRIRAIGGHYIRDRTTGQIIDASKAPTIVDRIQ